MENINGFDFFRLHFDADGNLMQQQELDDFKQRAAQATDAIFIAHGFRNDENDAMDLFSGFLTTFRQHVDGPFKASLGSRRFVVAGVFWPSKKFPEDVKFDGSAAGVEDEAVQEVVQKEQARAMLLEMRDTEASAEQKPRIDQAIALLDQVKQNPAAQNELVQHVLSLLENSEPDPTEGVENVRAKSGSELLELLGTPIRNPVTPSSDSEGGATGLDDVFIPGEDGGTQSIGSFFGSIFGRIGMFLNLTTWYVMKNRSGVVGANGVAKAVRELRASAPEIKIHLAGHSLGGRLMAGCSKSLAQDPPPQVRPDSLTLLEAAFSHFGFSANNGQGQVGFFRAVVDKQLVKGPFLATFSAQDSVVGIVYATASRLAGQNVEAIGDANDPFGGIGRNGAQKTAEATTDKLHVAGTPYQFTAGKILSLDGSGGLIKDHFDVKNANVTYAFASAVAAT
jgi:hypothetical protein